MLFWFCYGTSASLSHLCLADKLNISFSSPHQVWAAVMVFWLNENSRMATVLMMKRIVSVPAAESLSSQIPYQNCLHRDISINDCITVKYKNCPIIFSVLFASSLVGCVLETFGIYTLVSCFAINLNISLR